MNTIHTDNIIIYVSKTAEFIGLRLGRFEVGNTHNDNICFISNILWNFLINKPATLSAFFFFFFLQLHLYVHQIPDVDPQ